MFSSGPKTKNRTEEGVEKGEGGGGGRERDRTGGRFFCATCLIRITQFFDRLIVAQRCPTTGAALVILVLPIHLAEKLQCTWKHNARADVWRAQRHCRGSDVGSRFSDNAVKHTRGVPETNDQITKEGRGRLLYGFRELAVRTAITET